MKDLFKDIIICPFCGVPVKIVWIHGHGQCANCKNVIDECCRGENNEDTTTDNENPNQQNPAENENKQD